jgi:anaerobic selenocysteine-containing dehydrogenase
MNFFCSKDCPDLCGINIDTTSPLQAQGIPEPWSDPGFVCRKFKIFAAREINNGEKSWHQQNGVKTIFDDDQSALSALSELLHDYREKKILFMRGSGSLGYNMSSWDILLSQFKNCWAISGGPCDETGYVAHETDFGCLHNPAITNLAAADNIILYGKNAAVTSPHLFAYLKKLKQSGKKLIYIDPFKTPTAAIADYYIQINPGTDGLLACALLCALGLEERHDQELLRAKTGITEQSFTCLIDSIKNGKTAHIQGAGLQRQRHGMNAFRWINRLAVMTGSQELLYWGHSSKRFWQKPQLNFAGYVHVHRIAATLAAGTFDLFVCVAGNPAMSYPDSNLWDKALKKTTTVVVGTNNDTTTQKADFFLKVGGMFAQQDFMASYFFSQHYSREKLTKDLSDTEAVSTLADQLGLSFELKPAVQLQYENQQQRIYSTEKLDLHIPEKACKFKLLTSSHACYLNSQTLPGMEQGLQVVHINTADAKTLDIYNGMDLVIKSDCGEFIAEALVTDNIAPHTLMCWKNIPMKQGQTNNAIPNGLTDSQEGLAYYAAKVEVKKIPKL